MYEKKERPQARFINASSRFAMYAPTDGDGKESPRLEWAWRNGYPRIMISTNDPSDPIPKGLIIAAMNPTTFEILLSHLEQLEKEPENSGFKVPCYGSIWENGEKVSDKGLKNEILIGKNTEGLIWIRVVERNRPSPTFTFAISDYHGIVDLNGNQISAQKASALECKATVSLLRRLNAHVQAAESKMFNPIVNTISPALPAPQAVDNMTTSATNPVNYTPVVSGDNFGFF